MISQVIIQSPIKKGRIKRPLGEAFWTSKRISHEEESGIQQKNQKAGVYQKVKMVKKNQKRDFVQIFKGTQEEGRTDMASSLKRRGKTPSNA